MTVLIKQLLDGRFLRNMIVLIDVDNIVAVLDDERIGLETEKTTFETYTILSITNLGKQVQTFFGQHIQSVHKNILINELTVIGIHDLLASQTEARSYTNKAVLRLAYLLM